MLYHTHGVQVSSYRFDDLGWYQFEALIQNLLKACFSAAIEAWGGHKDHGRDAFYAHPLPFPDSRTPAPHPFLFQVKFIANANAAGAINRTPLLRAIKAEIATRTSDEQPITSLGTYVLLTNAPLTAKLREDAEQTIAEAIKPQRVHVFGAQDISGWLDNAPNLRQAFPQLLGLRDLEELIGKAIAKPVHERSASSLQQASRLATVFVPTEAYNRAWLRLRKHGFVVLEGPPEVGKTAIARMISLTQHSLGWEAYECNDPDDVFRVYNAHQSQIFLADDAFGSTEYDPGAARKWTKDTERLLDRVDDRHWLVWTARKHILQIALKHAHLQGRSERFPEPGDVLVDVGEFRDLEKAMMLYRHAKAAGLEEPERTFVKQLAPIVVQNQHFTPERVRRFVSNRVRPLTANNTHPLDQYELAKLVAHELENPTDAMIKTYRALPEEHRSLLISLLDVGYEKTITQLGIAYERHRPDDASVVFDVVFSDLLHAFVRRVSASRGDFVDWIHPSLRDLVIDELSSSSRARTRFLTKCDLPGIHLALSTGGGRAGARLLPFLQRDDDWDLLGEALKRVLRKGQDEQLTILSLLGNTLSHDTLSTTHKNQLRRITVVSLELCRTNWDTSRVRLSGTLLRHFFSLAESVNQWIPSPNLEATWQGIVAELRVEGRIGDGVFNGVDLIAVSELSELAELCKTYDPRFLKFAKWPDDYREELTAVEKACEEYADQLNEYDGDEVDAGDHAYRAKETASALRAIASHAQMSSLDDSADSLYSAARSLSRKIDEYESEDDDVEQEPATASLDSGASVRDIFEDL